MVIFNLSSSWKVFSGLFAAAFLAKASAQGTDNTTGKSLEKRSYTPDGRYIPPFEHEALGIQMPSLRVHGQDAYYELPPSIRANRSGHYNGVVYDATDHHQEHSYDQDVYNTQLENSGWNELRNIQSEQVEGGGDHIPQRHQGGGIPLYNGAAHHRVRAERFNPNSVPSTVALAGVGALSLGRLFRGAGSSSSTPSSHEISSQNYRRQKSKKVRRGGNRPARRRFIRYEGEIEEEKQQEEVKPESESEGDSDYYTGISDKEGDIVYNEIIKPVSSSEDESVITSNTRVDAQDLSETFYDSCNVYADEPVRPVKSIRRKTRVIAREQ